MKCQIAFKSLVASPNFVERAVQTHAIGARLKEVCHLNRNLLSLTTVIRELRSCRQSFVVAYVANGMPSRGLVFAVMSIDRHDI